jgi:hypothetical protein
MKTINDINEVFPKVLKMVENKHTISGALLKLNVSRFEFYDKINKEQKVLLQMAKTANAGRGMVKAKYTIK